MQLGYDPTDAASILDFALPLTGKKLSDFLTQADRAAITENASNKGDLGNLIEKYYFHWVAGNKRGPDFPEAGVELKTAAVIPHKKYGYAAKERLKLTSINFRELEQETWDNNTLMQKCEKLLLLFTLYEQTVPKIDRVFITKPKLWSIPQRDIAIIKADWEKIHAKVKANKAENLSGRDTLYLEACTSGASGETAVQSTSMVRAKKRAFAFKASYVTAAMLSDKEFDPGLEPLLKPGEAPVDFEKIVLRKLSNFYNQEIEQIKRLVAPNQSRSKHQLARLGYAMLGIKSNRAEEFIKAGIEIKAINLNPNCTPNQAMSFPAFSYINIVNEDWEQSTFKDKLDRKFLFLIFQKTKDGRQIFAKAKFWAMPEKDFVEAKRVWEETRDRIVAGKADKLPLTDFSSVAHVRPHGKNSKPENHIESPLNGRLTQKSFWLNSQYIKSQLIDDREK